MKSEVEKLTVWECIGEDWKAVATIKTLRGALSLACKAPDATLEFSKGCQPVINTLRQKGPELEASLHGKQLQEFIAATLTKAGSWARKCGIPGF